MRAGAAADTVTAMSEDRARSDATQRRMETAALPPFGEEREAVWGAAWGAATDAGRLRRVLVRAPGSELERIDAAAYDPAADALVDPEGRWYWLGSEPPDLGRAHAQHEALVAALEAEGVTVDRLAPLGDRFAKAMYIRDPLVVLPEGLLVGRMGVRMRRGEEASVTAEAAALGAPVLATVTGDGVLEGGTVLRLAPDLWAAGTGVRCNARGFERLRDVLGWMGVELLYVPLPGWSIHLDMHMGVVDSGRVLARSHELPYDFLETLRARGIEVLDAPAEEPSGVNLLCLRPGRVLMAAGNPRTEEVLAGAGVEVVTVAYDELWKNGGGIHCSTQELIRDPCD
jgi:N-dimethylarginine dimethylaminohydrolase